MNILSSFARILEFLDEPGAFHYFLAAKKPSLSSYRICKAIKSLVGEPATVIDVGANQGQFAGAARWWFPNCNIICFEPSRVSFKALEVNTSSMRGIRLVSSALGSTIGVLEFFESSYSHASSALRMNDFQKTLRSDFGKLHKVSVPVTTLTAFAREESWSEPILLKLDVQGFEKKVLEGALAILPTIEFLLFECSYRPLYEQEPVFDEMYGFVSSIGYELVAPVGFLRDNNHAMIQSDLLWRRSKK
jgi:FkbM family methyltransferase